MSRADSLLYELLARCCAANLPVCWLEGDVRQWELIAQLRAQLAAHEARALESEARNDR